MGEGTQDYRAVRLGGAALALGAAGVIATSVFYGLSPQAAAAPIVPLDLAAAAAGAVKGAATMHLAGLVGVPADVLITAASFMLATRTNRAWSALGWFLIGTSTILFAVVDSLVGFVLPEVAAATGASAAFLVAKRLFDVLFMLGTATFGAGAMLAPARDAFRGGGPIPRLLAGLAVLAGAIGLAGGFGGLLGYNLAPAMGAGILGGSILYTFVGLALAFARPVTQP